MDGRDNENKTSSSTPQAIFTPPVSDDSAEQNANNVSAPIVSSPMGNQVAFTNSAHSDIILSNGSQKASINKKPLIIALIAIIITIVILTVIIFTMKKNQPVTLSVTYNNFVHRLNNSPDDEYRYDPSNPDSQERFYEIAGELLNSDEKNEYYNSLENDYRSLRDQLKESNRDSLRSLGEQLEDIFPIYFAMMRQSDINDQLIYDIAYGRDKEAQELIAKISALAQDNKVNRAEKAAHNFIKYLETTYDLYSIYQEQGCIQSDGSSFNFDCVKKVSTGRVSELKQQAKEFLDLAEINTELLDQDFYNLLNNIKLETERDNE